MLLPWGEKGCEPDCLFLPWRGRRLPGLLRILRRHRVTNHRSGHWNSPSAPEAASRCHHAAKRLNCGVAAIVALTETMTASLARMCARARNSSINFGKRSGAERKGRPKAALLEPIEPSVSPSCSACSTPGRRPPPDRRASTCRPARRNRPRRFFSGCGA